MTGDARAPANQRRDTGAPAAAGPAPTALPDSLLAVSIRLPAHVAGDAPERVVRPALAVLFRIAVGPSADRYVRRFLAFERTGRGRPGWHWPSLVVPGVWAFYRKLWLTGVVFTLLPIAGALAFAAFDPQFESADFVWVVSAFLAVWILPGVLPALLADSLLYAHVRELVRSAERGAKSANDAVQRLAELAPTSNVAALCLGGGAMIIVGALLLPHLRAAYVDLGIRAQLAQTLASVRALQNEIEATWTSARLLPRQSDHAAVRAQPGASLIADLDVDPLSGRVRVALGPEVPELAGRTILLAPRRDAHDHVQWLCVPVDIPSRYLPKECRG